MSQSTARLHDLVFFVALFATALAMGAALAHALELANKITLARQDYFVVQRIYAGWSRLGYLLAVQLAGMLGVIVLYRRQRRVLLPALIALGGLVGAQAVFWTFTFPANRRRRTGPSSRKTGRACADTGNIRISPARSCRRWRWRA